ncbi:MAG TPA: hypothetical protein VIJ75_10080 [Hanamia sp.]
MNHKNQITAASYIGNALKIFVTKLIQHPDYYNTKHDHKTKRRYRHNNKAW